MAKLGGVRGGGLERRHHGGPTVGLLQHGRRRSGGLFNQRGILLRDMVHFADGLVDLLDGEALFGAGGCNVADDAVDVVDAPGHLVHRCAGVVDQLGSLAYLRHRIADQCLDLPGGIRRATRQAAHLGRDNREATPLFAGARRVHRRVQGQDIGLERDIVDDADDLDDLVGRDIDGAHDVDH